MANGIVAVIVEVTLFVMRVIGVKAQNQKAFLDAVQKVVTKSNGLVKMKDTWKKLNAELDEKIKNSEKLKNEPNNKS